MIEKKPRMTGIEIPTLYVEDCYANKIALLLLEACKNILEVCNKENITLYDRDYIYAHQTDTESSNVFTPKDLTYTITNPLEIRGPYTDCYIYKGESRYFSDKQEALRQYIKENEQKEVKEETVNE